MKRIIIILCCALVVFSCKKDDNISIIILEIESPRIKSVKHYTKGVLNSADNYIYDNNGRLISYETNYFNENGEQVNSFNRTFEYEENKIIEYRKDYFTGNDSGIKTEREIEKGAVSKIYAYKWNGEIWELESRTSYIYKDAKLIRWNRISLGPFEGMTEGEIEYDGHLPMQKIDKQLNYYLFDSWIQTTYFNKEIYSYSDGLLQKITRYYTNDGLEDWRVDNKIEIMRSGNEITKNSYYYSNDETWIFNESSILTYDMQANISKIKTMYPNGDYIYETVIEYEDKPGNWFVVLENPDQHIYEITLTR